MEILEYIHRQIAAARRLFDAAMQDTTEEQFNWLPPGTANSIKAGFLHTLASEDRFIQLFIQGRPRLWESQGWSEKVGLAVPPGRDGGWDEIKLQTVKLVLALAYAQAVRAATDAFIAGLSAGDLDREVTWMGGPRPVAEMLILTANHTAGHAGEIAAIKGLQGVKGLPF